jgi:hypothetical protein
MAETVRGAALETFNERKAKLPGGDNVSWEIWKKAFEAASVSLPDRKISEEQLEEFVNTVMQWDWAMWAKDKNREALRCLLKELIRKV